MVADIHTLKQATDIDINAFESYNLSKRGLIEQIAPRYRYTYFAACLALPPQMRLCAYLPRPPLTRVDFPASGENVRKADKRGAGPAGLAPP